MSEKEKDTSKTQEELPEDEVENEGQDEGQEDNTKGEGIGEDVTSVYDDEDEAQDDSKDDSKNKRDKDDDEKKDDDKDKEDENDEEEKKDEGQDDDKSDEGQKGEEGKEGQDSGSKDGESDVDGSDAQKEAEGAEKGNSQPDAENDMSLQEPTENTGGNLGDTGSTDVPANSSNAAGSTAEGAGASGATGTEGSAGAAGAEGASATGTSAGASTAGGAAAEGTAAAGTAAAEGTAAGGAAASGTAAGAGTAAGGTAAGGAAAGGTAAAGSTAVAAGAAAGIGVFGIVLLVILIIFIIIGIFGFLTAIPSMTLEKLKEFAQGIWDGVEGYFIKDRAEALINQEDLVNAAQYLYDMGYDLEGCGFVKDVKFETDENGNSTGVIEEVESTYLNAYLVAENKTYIINNYSYSWATAFSSIMDGSFFSEGPEAWGSGMLNFDEGLLDKIGMPLTGITIGDFNVGEFVRGIKVDRENNSLRIRKTHLKLDFWNSYNDYTYYNLAGWTGRYGKPFELLVALHLATMAPDFAYQIAMNDDLDAKVNIGFKDATFEGEIKIQKSDGTVYTMDQLDEAGYSEETIKQLEELNKKAGDIKTETPYIKTVEKHWFRNVYFDTEGEEVEYAVVDEKSEEEQKEEEENLSEEEKAAAEYDNEPEDTQYKYTEGDDGKKQLVTTSGAIDVYETSDSTETFEYTGDEIEGLNSGDKIIYEGSIADRITQKEDGVRGVTNPTTKELFKGEYYIYDGTIEKANNIKDGKEEKQQIQFNDNSLSAFSILEHETSIDSQLIYRDLKELLVELDYFDYSDFEEDTERLLEWPIPDYQDTAWPDRKMEKQVLEYGTLIASKSAVDAFKAEEAKEAQEENAEGQTQETEENTEEENATENPDSVEGFIMIGDSWTVGMQGYASGAGVNTICQSGASANTWVGRFSEISGKNPNGVIVFLGINDTAGSSSSSGMESLLGKIKAEYSSVPIYVVKVPHMGKNPDNGLNVDEWNGRIDSFNSSVQSYCSSNGIKYIDASSVIVGSDGYLKSEYASGGYHLTSAGYEAFFNEIKKQVAEGGSEEETVGFEPGLDVVAMADCKVIEEVNLIEAGHGFKFELTGDTMLKGYNLIIAGCDFNIGVGDELKMKDVIGTTNENSICLVLIDLEKSNVENIEEYIRVPRKSTKLAGDTPEEKVWIALKAEGYSDEAVAGVMGNISGESGFNSGAVEGGSGIGFGLCQWSFGRRTALENFAASRGVDPSDVDLQIEFLIAELRPEGGADGFATYQFAGYENYRNTWMTSKSIEETTTAFCAGFERPGIPRNQVRIEAAKKYYEQYAGAY